MSNNFPNPVSNISSLKQEIERLTRELSEALRAATFVGMTPEEALAHDERRARINALTQKLALLQEPQSTVE